MPDIIPDPVREAVVARVPQEVREAFDAAVDAHRRFHATYSMLSGRERIAARRSAVNDLAAANRVLAARNRDLPQQAARAAQIGGA